MTGTGWKGVSSSRHAVFTQEHRSAMWETQHVQVCLLRESSQGEHVAKLPLSEENDSRSELAVPYVKLSFKTPAKRPYSSSTPALRRSDVFSAVAQALVVNTVQRKPCKSRARLFVVT